MRIKDADAEILLAHICGKSRTWIMAHDEHTLTPAQKHQWNMVKKRREQGEPIAYITGEREFFGRSFHVDPSVLIPRPSTEGLVEMVLALAREKSEIRNPKYEIRVLDAGIIGISEIWGTLADIHTIVDVGTGSGCIAITLACELPEIHIIALDISAAALRIARKNAKRHRVGERIHFLQGNLLEPVLGIQEPFLLVSNPPYIPEGEKLPHDVAAYEPSIALRAGPDGLAVLHPLLAAARSHPACMGFVVECREDFDEKATEGENALL